MWPNPIRPPNYLESFRLFPFRLVRIQESPLVASRDLSASFRGRGIERSKPLMWENRFPVYGHVLDKSPILAIRDGRWKLLLNPDRSRVELFDIPNDPTEMNNLAGEQPAVVARLSERVLGWQKTLPEGPIDPAAGQAEYAWPD